MNMTMFFYIAIFLRAMTLLTPIALLFYQYNGLSVVELFYFQGIFYLTSILSEAPVGYFSDIISRKKILIFSFSLFLLVIAFWLFFKGYYVVLIGEICFAISKIMMDNTMSGYLYDLLKKHNSEGSMPKCYSYLNIYLALGTTVAALLGTFLYSYGGIRLVLLAEIILIFSAIILVSYLPDINHSHRDLRLSKNKISYFWKSLKLLHAKKEIKYHIYQSGLLTSCSVFFALSFQPIIQNALLPIFMFGFVGFLNHGLRALASYISGKYNKLFDLSKVSKILLIAYSLSFIFILFSYKTGNKILSIFTIVITCVLIGLQLIFTILHVSRLHKLVSSQQRGSIMAINNFVSRIMTAVLLISSKLLINNNMNLEIYYLLVLIIFFIFSSFFNNRIKEVKDV